MRLDISAPRQVLETLAGVGRTEDLRFSPNRQRLALVAMARQRLFVFTIRVQAGKRIELSDVVELFSPHLQAPHGLDFLDDDTLAVANRDGELCLFKVPPHDGRAKRELTLIRRFPAQTPAWQGPGSVAASRCAEGHYELMVCRNVGNQVSRHLITATPDHSSLAQTLLPNDWMATPNGISIGATRRWRALSNLHDQCALIYAHERASQQPAAVLRGASHPHGIRLSDDDRYLLLADAGGPYVHLYHQHDGQWQGVYDPALSLRVMDETLFQSRHAFPPNKGGPKGLDLDTATGILATTSQTQPLAFFDLDQVLARVRRQGPCTVVGSTPEQDVRYQLERQRRHVRIESEALRQEHRAGEAERMAALAAQRAAEVTTQAAMAANDLAEQRARTTYFQTLTQDILASSSWRITGPLRRIAGRRRAQSPSTDTQKP